MSIVSPFEDASAWDSLDLYTNTDGRIEQFSWPNTSVEFSGDIANEWDVKKAKGSDGARMSDNGYSPTEITCEWLLWKPEHFRVYEEFVVSAKPRLGRGPKPMLAVFHPILQMYGLIACRLKSVSFLDFSEVDQWRAKISLIEFVPEPKRAKKPVETMVPQRVQPYVAEGRWGRVPERLKIPPPSPAPKMPSSSKLEPPVPTPSFGPAMNK